MGCDVYTCQFVIDALSVVWFVWVYFAVTSSSSSSSAAAAAATTRQLVASVQQNMLPGAFVLQLFVLTLLLAAERVAYTLHSVYVKAFLHTCTTAACLVVYLVWLQLFVHDRADDASRYNNNSNNNDSSSAGATAAMLAPARALLLLRLCGLWCSARQLRGGYAVYHTPYTLTARTDVWHWAAHTLFRAVPFLLELRLLLDWSFSTTALKLQHWMLIEDVHHVLYVRYVDMRDLAHTSAHHGRTFPRHVKAYQGVLGFCSALLVVFFPLFYYSSLSPQVRGNAVVVWQTQLSLAPHSGGAPLYSAVARLQHDTRTVAAQTSTTTTATTATTTNDTRQVADETAWRALRETVWRHSDAHVASTVQLLLWPACSAVSWHLAPPAWRALRAMLAYATSNNATTTTTTAAAAAAATDDDDAALYILQTHDVTRAVSAARALATMRVVRRYRVPAASLQQLRRALDAVHNNDNDNKTHDDDVMWWRVQLPHFWPSYALNTPTEVSLSTRDVADDDDDNDDEMRGRDCVLQLRSGHDTHNNNDDDVYACIHCAITTATTATSSSSSAVHDDKDTSDSNEATTTTATTTTLRWPLPPYVTVSSPDVLVTMGTLSFMPNLGIVALYTTFVFALSRVVRSVVAGEAFRASLTQLADPEPLAELLRFVYLARSSASNGHVEDALLEQHLFAMLLDLLRTPDRLARRSGWRVDDYGVHGYLRRRLRMRWRRPFDVQQQPPYTR